MSYNDFIPPRNPQRRPSEPSVNPPVSAIPSRNSTDRPLRSSPTSPISPSSSIRSFSATSGPMSSSSSLGSARHIPPLKHTLSSTSIASLGGSNVNSIPPTDPPPALPPLPQLPSIATFASSPPPLSSPVSDGRLVSGQTHTLRATPSVGSIRGMPTPARPPNQYNQHNQLNHHLSQHSSLVHANPANLVHSSQGPTHSPAVASSLSPPFPALTQSSPTTSTFSRNSVSSQQKPIQTINNSNRSSTSSSSRPVKRVSSFGSSPPNNPQFYSHVQAIRTSATSSCLSSSPRSSRSSTSSTPQPFQAVSSNGNFSYPLGFTVESPDSSSLQFYSAESSPVNPLFNQRSSRSSMNPQPSPRRGSAPSIASNLPSSSSPLNDTTEQKSNLHRNFSPQNPSPPLDIYRNMASTPPLRLKSSQKNLVPDKASQPITQSTLQPTPQPPPKPISQARSNAASLPPIQTSIMPSDMPRGAGSNFASALSPTTTHGKLRPSVTGSSIKTVMTSNSNPSVSGNKLLNTISSSVKSLSSQPGGPKPADIIQTVSSNAKYYQDRDIENKLRLLVASQFKFDEIIEFGFPIHLGPHDISLIGGQSSPSNESLSPSSGLSGDVAPPSDLSSPTSLSHWHSQHAALEQIRESMDFAGLTQNKANGVGNFEVEGSRFSESRMSMGSSGLTSPMSAVPRDMTLKFTLTPASMRADEAIIYGWQKSLGASDEALEELDDEDYSQSTGTSLPTSSGDVTITQDSTSGSANSIPVGGFGKDSASSKKMMKRMFGKLKKNPKSSGPSVMITSADLN